ncbi:hypothetical protein BFW38_03995 [Terasakiispira papahanaumokuakeensis]|uniref:Uncharacterized protein n=1 Tax=Terasakiispira papahanaumokuakeensis TaxID=197479 RepID=A0A1E2V776_9GAMM|nr:hypothetical protein [Terasakiispira papahanaumokuakeensis]ODC02837.1 hypothetical protein BFW38_03995 [Terasakiispira papahanaumokuakeensis]
MGFIGVLLHFLGLGICLLGLTWRKKCLVAGTVVAIVGFLIGTSPFWLVPYIPYEAQSVSEPSTTHDQASMKEQSGTPQQHSSTRQETSMSLEALDDVLEQTEAPTEATSAQPNASEHSPSSTLSQ